jgi:hypothetical protein
MGSLVVRNARLYSHKLFLIAIALIVDSTKQFREKNFVTKKNRKNITQENKKSIHLKTK